jgi:hypothetical protein
MNPAALPSRIGITGHALIAMDQEFIVDIAGDFDAGPMRCWWWLKIPAGQKRSRT